LAKALNCENPTNGEPDGTCSSCRDIESGRSFDLHELDAASNNKVDDIRELISRVALGSPGRTKVYILDEVHMLSSGAENALLKTLEEPPEHVVFVLATTEPQKVVQTIKSRTQHFLFHLLPAAELEAHLRWVIADAELDVDDDGIAWALRTGGGSARDTLSALDLVVASGGAPETTTTGADLCRAIANRSPEAAIAAVQKGLEVGSEPRIIGEDLLVELRAAFLASMKAPLTHLNDAAAERANELARALGPATITRSLEKIGAALVEVRQAPDPRVPIEVALLQLARAEGDDTAALLHRIEVLEAQVAALVAAEEPNPQSSPSPAVAPASTSPAAPARRGPTSAARDALTASESRPTPPRRGQPPAPPTDASPTDASPTDASPTEASPTDASPTHDPASVNVAAPEVYGSFTMDEITEQLPGVLEGLSQKVRARFRQGRPVEVADGIVTFAYPNQLPADRAIDVKGELEQAMSARFNCPVRVNVVVDQSRSGGPPQRRSSRQAAPTPSDSEEDIGPVSELKDADDSSNSMVDRLTAAFPGAKLIDPPSAHN
jgi:DNA polymerase-3 subunit gamma/tau